MRNRSAVRQSATITISPAAMLSGLAGQRHLGRVAAHGAGEIDHGARTALHLHDIAQGPWHRAIPVGGGGAAAPGAVAGNLEAAHGALGQIGGGGVEGKDWSCHADGVGAALEGGHAQVVGQFIHCELAGLLQVADAGAEAAGLLVAEVELEHPGEQEQAHQHGDHDFHQREAGGGANGGAGGRVHGSLICTLRLAVWLLVTSALVSRSCQVMVRVKIWPVRVTVPVARGN